MSDIRLSICIPTYNFGAYIGQTLDSIARQVLSAVEVIIVDGASADNTADVVAGYQGKIPRLRYYRLGARGGIDADMARSVELAVAPYCWLFSADDIMEQDSVERILRELDSGCDVYLCGLTICSSSMVPIARHDMLRTANDQEFDLRDERERHTYFREAESSRAFFSYMSSIIINRNRWTTTVVPPEFMGSCWAHVARIFGMIPHGLRVKCLSGSYLFARTGNDSFLEKGLVNRIGISVNGYWRLADATFGEASFEAWHIRRVVGKEFRIRFLLAAKARTRSSGELAEARVLDQLVSKIYQDSSCGNWLSRAAYRLTPLPLASVAMHFFPHGLRRH